MDGIEVRELLPFEYKEWNLLVQISPANLMISLVKAILSEMELLYVVEKRLENTSAPLWQSIQ